jgi:hypothetical protein
MLEQHGGAALGQEARLDFGDLQGGGDGRSHAHEALAVFQMIEKIA